MRFVEEWKKDLGDRLTAADKAKIDPEEIDAAIADSSRPENRQVYDSLIRRRVMQAEDALFRIAKAGDSHTATRDFLRANDPRYRDGEKSAAEPEVRRRDRAWLAKASATVKKKAER